MHLDITPVGACAVFIFLKQDRGVVYVAGELVRIYHAFIESRSAAAAWKRESKRETIRCRYVRVTRT